MLMGNILSDLSLSMEVWRYQEYPCIQCDLIKATRLDTGFRNQFRNSEIVIDFVVTLPNLSVFYQGHCFTVFLVVKIKKGNRD